MSTDGASGITKTGLPEDGQVEKPFHKYHGRPATHRFPGNETSFGAWQQPMGKSSSDTTSVQIDDLAILPARKDYTPAEGVAAMVIDQTHFEKPIERTAEGREMATEVSAMGIPNA